MSNLSAGVQILIDQLASNPDEFFGDLNAYKRMAISGRSGKFSSWPSTIESELLPVHNGAVAPERPRTWFLTDEERAALAAAYVEARKLRFDAEIIATMAEKPEETFANTTSGFYTTKGHPGVAGREVMRIDANGVLGIGTTSASTLANSGYVISGSSS